MATKINIKAGLMISALIALTPSYSFARNAFGAGVIIGAPTGISVKYNTGSSSSYDGALAFFDNGNIHIHGTRLWLNPRLFNLGHKYVHWYYGAGLRLLNHDHRKDDEDLHLGVRAPIGLRMMFNEARLELFTEASLTMDVLPKTDLDFDLGVGLRFYF